MYRDLQMTKMSLPNHEKNIQAADEHALYDKWLSKDLHSSAMSLLPILYGYHCKDK
jgi:hypothetical protein